VRHSPSRERPSADLPLGLSIAQTEADFYGHLEVGDSSVRQMAANRLHFEPVQAAQSSARLAQDFRRARVIAVIGCNGSSWLVGGAGCL
jgi:hypothetical protein